MPARDGVQLVRSGERRHVLNRRVVLVHSDRREHDLARPCAGLVVGVDELLRHDRADVGAVRVHELQHHDRAAQAGQRHGVAPLVGEPETRRRDPGDRESCIRLAVLVEMFSGYPMAAGSHPRSRCRG
jgi:hypothetical protein